jgi:hypothetical protein
MASRREKRSERREELSDQHLGVHEEDLGEEPKGESPHQARLERKATWGPFEPPVRFYPRAAP